MIFAYNSYIFDARYFQMSPIFWRVGASGPQNWNSWLEHWVSVWYLLQISCLIVSEKKKKKK